jgi:class 3 adenylate cyclase
MLSRIKTNDTSRPMLSLPSSLTRSSVPAIAMPSSDRSTSPSRKPAKPRPCPGCGHPSPPGAEFCPECAASTVAKVEHSQAVASTPPTTPAAQERRQLTILFCDMAGSSALSARLDPEEQGEVIAAFHSCCAREIKALDGIVAQYLGDGVLAYFGYPAAHEDDAERAVRAGLSILDAVSSARPAQHVAVQARIGVATGVVMVGDLVGEGITQENAAIGETTNLAARLQSLAAPNSTAPVLSYASPKHRESPR